MRRDVAIAAIVDLCSKGAGFRLDAAALAAEIATPNRAALIQALLECGVIPESFGHDSTEEKLYSKYSDVLLAEALTAMGLKCAVIEERADRADVEGIAADYSIVGDAKAFRLSRTAKNQKDFKVTALSGWRGNMTYALLVCPLYQYPNTRSQIYTQATRQNVTLLGYVHLAFLVKHTTKGKANLPLVWNVGAGMQPTNEAGIYWRTIDQAVCRAVGKTPDELSAFKRREQEILQAIKDVEVQHLQGEVERAMKLTKEEAIQKLVAEMNIASRIKKINAVTY
jgi:hypothetical protein